MSDQSDEGREIVCTLDEQSRERRAEQLCSKLLPHLEAVERIDDGIALRFAGGEESLEAVTKHVRREAACCSFARYEIEIAPETERIDVRVTGEGTEMMLTEGLASAGCC